MYPRFSDLINGLFGTNIVLPVQTYGFFVALAFVVAGFFVYLELKRKRKAGIIPTLEKMVVKGKPASAVELAFTGLLYFVIGFKITGLIIDYDIFTDNPQDYLISTQGSIVGGLIIMVLSVAYSYRQGQKQKLDKPVKVSTKVFAEQLTPTIVLIAAIAGILGAKLFDMVEHLGDFFRDPLGTLFSFSGLTFYGGLIVAAFAVAIYGERNKIKWPVIADTVAPGLMIAYAVGRIGCQLSGDGCWGVPNLEPKPEWLSFLPDWMWAFNYPHNVINEGVLLSGCDGKYCHALGQPVFPTPFYETTICTMFFLVLWFIRKKITIPGMLFSFYLVLNGIERFLIESIRVNIKYNLIGFNTTQAQAIAIFLMLIGITGLIYFWQRFTKQQAL
jgi:prolipoprotein diacylglyceryltransferase